jgi:hypothetical protein
MLEVPRHSFSREEARKTLDAYRAYQRSRASDVLPSLLPMLREVRQLADLVAAVDPESSELPGLARRIARYASAHFTLGRRADSATFVIGEAPCTLQSEVAPSDLRAGTWLCGFFFAWASRDSESLALLSQFPTERFSDADAYRPELVRALVGALFNDPDTGDHLVHGMELADPERVKETSPLWLLDFHVPVFENTVPLLDRDEAAFERTLSKALNLRRSFFEKRGQPDPESGEFIATEPLGLACWARTLGMEVRVRSPYLPPSLLDLEAPEVVACPRCFTARGPQPVPCPACNAPGDDLLEFAFDAYWRLDRDPCDQCRHWFPIMAQRCPVCGTSR